MKPETIIQQGLKSANILLKNAQKRAAELDHLKGELVIITDANGKTFNRIAARYTVCHILECNGFIMPSEHTDEVYDAVDIRKTSYKNYRYKV